MLRGLIALAAATMLVACGESEEGRNVSSAGPEATKEPQAPPVLEDLIRKRGQLDDTVYRDERDAQAHEQFLVGLWDRLRTEDPYHVFARQQFAQLSLPAPGAAQTRDWGVPGIQVTPFDGAAETTDRAGFLTMLKQWQAEAWVLEQSEWHHDQFRPATEEAPARSRASATGHLFNHKLGRRLILEAKLDIEWADSTGADGAPSPPRPQNIVVAEMRAIERDGEPRFTPMASFDVAKDSAGRWKASQPVVLRDLDGDGLSEILLVGANLLYRNKGGGEFEKEQLADLPHPLDGAAVVADFTGDGIADLVGTARRGGLLLLFSGTPDGKFQAPDRPSFPTPFQAAQGITAGDIDGDGDLDLFVFQYRQPYVGGQMPSPYYDANDGYPSYLLRNDGGGNFSDITDAAGLGAKRQRRTYSAAIVDLDNDKKLDLLVVSDFAGLDLYRGDGKGKFSEVTDASVDERHAFGMAHTLDDFDGDGSLDFYMIGMASTTARRIVGMGIEHPGFPTESKMRPAMGYGNRMYLSRGKRFEAPAAAGRVARTGWSWGVTSADFDNDGDSDLYIANGHVSGASCEDYCTRFWSHDIFTDRSSTNPAVEKVFFGEMQSMLTRQTSWNGYEKNVLFLNASGEDFLNASYLLGMAHEFDSRAVASDDFDGDGAIDLLVVELDQKRRSEVVHLMRNKGQLGRHWIGARLQESAGGPSPLGAKVVLVEERGRRVSAVVAGDSFQAQHAPVAHFGLGPNPKLKALEIHWPNGAISEIAAPALDRYHVVEAPVDGQP